MSQTLFLTSQGLHNKKLKDVFISLLPKPASEIKVSFIITAAYGEEDNPTWIEVYRRQLKKCGIKDIEDLDLKDKSQKELEEILEDKDIIFVNGGNTYYLLYHVRKSGFDKILPQLINKGKLYVGISAGSILVGPSIELAGWKVGSYDKNVVNLEDLTGLQMIPFTIFPHTKPDHIPIVEVHSKNVDYPVFVLTDDQAVLVENNNYKIVGEGEEIIYNQT